MLPAGVAPPPLCGKIAIHSIKTCIKVVLVFWKMTGKNRTNSVNHNNPTTCMNPYSHCLPEVDCCSWSGGVDCCGEASGMYCCGKADGVDCCGDADEVDCCERPVEWAAVGRLMEWTAVERWKLVRPTN